MTLLPVAQKPVVYVSFLLQNVNKLPGKHLYFLFNIEQVLVWKDFLYNDMLLWILLKTWHLFFNKKLYPCRHPSFCWWKCPQRFDKTPFHLFFWHKSTAITVTCFQVYAFPNVPILPPWFIVSTENISFTFVYKSSKSWFTGMSYTKRERSHTHRKRGKWARLSPAGKQK